MPELLNNYVFTLIQQVLIQNNNKQQMSEQKANNTITEQKTITTTVITNKWPRGGPYLKCAELVYKFDNINEQQTNTPVIIVNSLNTNVQCKLERRKNM